MVRGSSFRSAAIQAEANSPAWLPGLVFMPVVRDPWRSSLDGRKAGAGKSDQLHVLLIEDDTTIADMYRVQLEYDGYRVTIATTAGAAMTDVAAARPDIILLDLLLPDRSGLDVMSQIKEAFPGHPPVVILSNYGEPTMIERGLALGAVEYLVKSRVTPESVSQSIPGWVEMGRAGEKHRYQ